MSTLNSIKNRLNWIDIIKGLCMLGIIMSHITHIYLRYYESVFLTGFFFVSGYTFNTKKNFKSFLCGKINALIVPMICFGTLDIVLSCCFKGNNMADRYIGLMLQRAGLNDDFWFLGCLFVVLILFYAFVKLSSGNIKILAVISIALNILGYLYLRYINIKLPWQFENVMVMELWTALGYICRCYENKISKMIKIKYLAAFAAVYILCVLMYDNSIDVHTGIYGNYGLFILFSFVGIFMLFIGSRLYDRRGILQFIGRNSLIFYALQSKAIVASKKMTEICGICFGEYVDSVIILVLSCLLIIPFVFLINRYFPFLIGNKKTV